MENIFNTDNSADATTVFTVCSVFYPHVPETEDV